MASSFKLFVRQFSVTASRYLKADTCIFTYRRLFNISRIYTKTNLPKVNISRISILDYSHIFNNSSTLYHDERPRDNGDVYFKPTEPKNSTLLFLKTLSNKLRFNNPFNPNDSKKPKKDKKRVPKLILLQNPFTWLMVKIDFGVLRFLWDPAFRERDFKFGTKQAISRLTQLISAGHYRELNGLLTKAARLSLMRELDRNWGDRQRSLLSLERDDIQITSPRKVYFIRMAEKKYCDVDMAFLALKWAPVNGIDALLFAEIFARFHREYTPHSIPEWTIAFFKVTRFEVLRR